MIDERERLLHRLHAVLRIERLSAVCYETHADRARASGHRRMAQALHEMAQSHDRHCRELASRIAELGGDPQGAPLHEELIANTSCWPDDDDMCSAFEIDLRAEDSEIEAYQVLLRQSDAHTASLCEDAIAEDRQHLRWLREQLFRGLELPLPEENLPEP